MDDFFWRGYRLIDKDARFEVKSSRSSGLY